MLTIRQNFLETIRGGNPDRFVNQFEYMKLVSNPVSRGRSAPCPKGGSTVNDWGVTSVWPEHVVTAFPLHTEEAIVLKDITKWKDVVKAPDPWSFADDTWARYEDSMAAVDRKACFATAMVAPGIFERAHSLMGMVGFLSSFYEEPESLRELIDFLADWEIELAKVIIKHQHPDALFHHDDWGTQTRTFLSPATFKEFFLPAYKKVYGYWKQNGVEVIIHHCDSYAATLVPYMIEMGIDVYQGAVTENDIPGLIQKYGGQISFHGGLDNGKLDKEDWSAGEIRASLRDIISKTGKRFIIPGLVQGGPYSTYEGVYDATNEAIEALSKEYF